MSLYVLGRISPHGNRSDARARLEKLGHDLGFTFDWELDPEDRSELDVDSTSQNPFYFMLVLADGDSDLSSLWIEWNDYVRSYAAGGVKEPKLRVFLHKLCPAVGGADFAIAIFDNVIESR